MSDKWKLILQSLVAVIGALSATVSQIYTDGSIPEPIRIALLIGGGVAAVLGSILAKNTIVGITRKDIDGDGVDEIIVEMEKKPEEPKSPPPVALLILVGFLAVGLLGGCSALDMHKYDPMTSAQIQKTLDYEEANYKICKNTLESLGANEVVLLSLDVRHESEEARLQAWLAAEEAKKLADDAK